MAKNISKRFVAYALSVVTAVSVTGIGTMTASAFDDEYLNKEGIELGYSIINGYTKMYLSHNPERNSGRIAVYSGVDLTSPYVIAMGGVYVLSHHIDIDRFITDNDYAMGFIADFDSFLRTVGIKNDKAKMLKSSLEADNIKPDLSLDTAGIYVFDSTNDYAYQLMNNNEYADFVLVDAKVPANMKDLNFDEKTDYKDAELIQHYLAGDLDLADDDEDAYALYASDYNKDKSIDIEDVTDLLRKSD